MSNFFTRLQVIDLYALSPRAFRLSHFVYISKFPRTIYFHSFCMTAQWSSSPLLKLMQIATVVIATLVFPFNIAHSISFCLGTTLYLRIPNFSGSSGIQIRKIRSSPYNIFSML
ncbi:hypothetical protein BDZ91DRAFT_526835 [Kalaharituber pfeilii]|nr:hypothetical protein BDZ91DRAFT_526835 [Kalaharituber pfeilii]